jgi:glycosyltransferase involved in cell wall biosynthesis
MGECLLHKIKPYGKETPFYAYYGGYVLRKFCSIAPYLGLVAKANTLGRKPGISALVRIRNEPWIEPSLLSIKDFADEIIVVDSSTDDTPKKVKNIMKEYRLNVKYIHKMCGMVEQFEIALKKSTHGWLLKWDGDFVGYTHRLKELKEFIMNLRPEKYYLIEFPLINIDVDLFHVMKGASPYHVESYLYTYSPLVHFTINPKGRWKGETISYRVGSHEFFGWPKFYEKIFLRNVYVMHLRTVKPPRRLLERQYQTTWIGEKNKQKYSYSFDEYLKICVKRDYGTEDLTKAEQIILETLKEKLIPYSKEIYGDYPEILKYYVKKEFNIEL